MKNINKILLPLSILLFCGWISGPPACKIVNVIEKENNEIIWNSISSIIGVVYSDSLMDYYEIYKRFPQQKDNNWFLLDRVENKAVDTPDILTTDKDFYIGESVQYLLYGVDLSGNENIDTSIEYKVNTHSNGIINECTQIIGGI